MAIRKFTVNATTGAGSVTVYSPYLSGYIESIQYLKTDYADTVDFAITAEATGENIWTQENVTAAAVVRPRAATHSTAGVAATYDSTAPVNDRIALGRDRVKIAIANGGTGKIGDFVIAVDDGR